MASNFQTSTCLKLRSAGDNILENHPFNDFMIISTDLCTKYSIFWCCSINNSRPVSLLWFISNSKVSNRWSNRWGTGRKQCVHNLWLSNDAASFEAAQNNNYYSPDTEMFLPSPGTFRDQILERQVQKTIIISVQWHQPLASGVSCRYTLGITVLPMRSPFPPIEIIAEFLTLRSLRWRIETSNHPLMPTSDPLALTTWAIAPVLVLVLSPLKLPDGLQLSFSVFSFKSCSHPAPSAGQMSPHHYQKMLFQGFLHQGDLHLPLNSQPCTVEI